MKSEDLQTIVSTLNSGVPGIHISGDDYAAIDRFISELAAALGFEVLEWNYGYGTVDYKNKHPSETRENEADVRSPASILKTMYETSDSHRRLLVIKNARLVFDGEANRQNLAQLQQTLFHIKQFKNRRVLVDGERYNAAIVYVDETRFIPTELASLIFYTELKPPTKDELADKIAAFSAARPKIEISAETKEYLLNRCVGMSDDVFSQVLEKAARGKDGFENVVKEIATEVKKQSVEKSGLLKFISSDTDINKDVGGLENLRSWLRDKQEAIKNAEKARAAGIEPAKGVLLVGMPGCGKTLTAQSIATMFGVPLLQLDMGSLMGKYVGQSEEKMRRALDLAEYSSPCVLWVDEIEKAFAGVAGDESGVTQRLFGYMLTWLQDHKKPVFVVATANDVAVLPPEFLRRGRFDELFYIDFPKEQERAAIFKIHIEKKKNLSKADIDYKKLAQHENVGGDDSLKDEKKPELGLKYPPAAGADIAAVVNDAAETAWKNNKPLSQEILENKLKYLKPLAKVLEDKIKRNKEKFGQYDLRSAGYDAKDLRRFEHDMENPKPEIRMEIAADERCPVNILEKLAKDPEPQVLLAVLKNPNCPTNIIADLQNNGDAGVQEEARKHFARTPEGREKLAKAQAQTAARGSEEEKLRLCKSSTLGDNAQEILARDSSKSVRLALLDHPYLNEKPLMLLAESDDVEIKNKALNHRQYSEKVKEAAEKKHCVRCYYRHQQWCSRHNKPIDQIRLNCEHYVRV
jgi:SpoVK/Ycf46/Vps4 family AAA+-type ATPase